MMWTHYLFGNQYVERLRRYKIAVRQYPKNMVNTSLDGFRYELHEMNSPRVRAAGGESHLLQQFTTVADAKAHAETLTAWSRIPGTRNGWRKGIVMVTCRRASHLPDSKTDNHKRLWGIYLDGEFVESCNNGKKAQMIGDELYDSNSEGLIDE